VPKAEANGHESEQPLHPYSHGNISSAPGRDLGKASPGQARRTATAPVPPRRHGPATKTFSVFKGRQLNFQKNSLKPAVKRLADGNQMFKTDRFKIEQITLTTLI
jgi:hypothetical protein